MQMVRCKVYSTFEGREKLLVPKLDYLVKHYGLKKCIVVKLGFVVGQFYSCPTNTHVKNEKLVASIRCNTIIVQFHNEGKVEKKKKKYHHKFIGFMGLFQICAKSVISWVHIIYT
jgi:hypothetical protein